ncbi:Coiled-coil domain-containing protein 6 [Microtus ochrogaster]|uniref:Coiled-coil domain-containing protein 6 n=1 Tax=Microtus ochrogaster TaxID=79684 RepID=A0A8J6GVV7_MICOH|nr:Coiled-coil domain-containing protein 6 [Microtus ochrogaster]
MADSASESDTDAAGGGPAAMQSSCSATSGGSGGGGGGKSGGIVISPFRLEELTNRLASLQQENKVLKIELETYKLKCKALQEENRDLRKASVTIQARAEQEEEFISNTLFKKIQALQKEKETLAVNYEKEEEFLTNELSRKLMQGDTVWLAAYVKAEGKGFGPETLAGTLTCKPSGCLLAFEGKRLSCVVHRVTVPYANSFLVVQFSETRICKASMAFELLSVCTRVLVFQLQHEKAELEQHLEQEQEFQVNKLMKKIKKLENDTISKQLTLEQLRREKIDLENTLEQEQEALVNRLWKRMDKLEAEKRILQEKLDQPVSAPPSPRDISMEIDSPENMMRHIRFLKNEVERLKKQLRAAQLQRQKSASPKEVISITQLVSLSESESSLEMDDERYFNEMSAQGLRPRTVSSPIPYTPSPSSSRPISPGLSYASHTVGFTPPTSLTRAGMSYYNSPGLHVQHMGASHGITRPSPRRSSSPDKFKRPTPPPSPNTQSPVQPPPPPPPPPMQPTAVPTAAASSQPAPSSQQHLVHPSSQP